ncbi:MAG: DUF1501 domain-containing protein [Planctomycetota bacterium]|nr:DUF1501 domain-containing protein [Planctomycetota bacterium]
MLSIPGHRINSFCDGLSRRNFLRIGALGLGGLSLPNLLRAEAAAGKTNRQKSVVMIYLPGGPTQHETFDPKPNAAREIRGSYRPISTKIPGVQYCELLPKLSAIADKFSVVRSLVGMNNRHESFQCYSGHRGGRPLDNEPAGGWPTFGSLVSKVLGPGPGAAMPYIDISPAMTHAPYRNRGIHEGGFKPSWPGFTGHEHAPFSLQGEIKKDLVLNGIDLTRLGNRRGLLTALDRLRRKIDSAALDNVQKQAFGLLTASRLTEVLDIEKEPKKVRDRYGETQQTDKAFGGAPQSAHHLLLARRLVEAGVRCVSVAFGAWDWHANREGTIEYLSKKYLPVFDHAVSVFLQDLEDRGLLETTTVIAWGEFGRTPKINPKGGRDHWPGTQSVLLAGGGIEGGRVIGETDFIGSVPVSRPVHVQEIFATLYQNLGIDLGTATVTDLTGRPRFLVTGDSRPVGELY